MATHFTELAKTAPDTPKQPSTTALAKPGSAGKEEMVPNSEWGPEVEDALGDPKIQALIQKVAAGGSPKN